MNRIDINAGNLRRLIPHNGKYTVIRHHLLDRRADVFGESSTFEGAVFIADAGLLEDEKLYNDCEELEGLGIGFSYLVFSPIGELRYKKDKIILN